MTRLATVLAAIGLLFGGTNDKEDIEPNTVAGKAPVYTVVGYSEKEYEKLVTKNAKENPSPTNSRAYARYKVESDKQFKCLNRLWGKESAWTHTADNPYSSAYGIPQAMPGNKMADMGADWRTNPVTQIDWGLKYIRLRYGDPCGAWSFFLKNNWY